MTTIEIKLDKGNILDAVSAECNLLARRLEVTAPNDNTGDAIRTLAGFINSPEDNVSRPVVARAMTEGWTLVKSVLQRYLALGRTYDDNRLESFLSNVDTPVIDDVASIMDISNASFQAQKGKSYTVSISCDNWDDNVLDFKVGNETVKNSISENATFTFTAPCDGLAVFCLAPIVDDDVDASGRSLRSVVPSSYLFNIKVTTKNFGFFNCLLSMPDSFNIAMTEAIKAHANKLIIDYVVSEVLKSQHPDSAVVYVNSYRNSQENLQRAAASRNSFGRSHHDWM